MKNVIKYGLVGLAGYLVGFYEFKYRMIKEILKMQLENDKAKETEAQ